MTENTYNYTKNTEYAAYAPIRKAYTITPGSTILKGIRAVMVSADATITGEFVEQPGVSFTTHTLKAGVLYPFSFRKITAVSTGTVKAFA